MLRQSLALALGAGLLIGFAGHADAKQVKSAMLKTVTVNGCARAAPPFCTIIGSGAQSYSLHSAAPPVPVNVGVTVVGVRDGDVSPCFAPPLKVLRWSRNRLRCPVY
jgi:hypothetical protein